MGMGEKQHGAAALFGLLLVGSTVPAYAADPSPTLIFFDSGKPVLTRDATEIVAIAFREAAPSARWLLIGHADRSGSSAANRRVALARATATRDYLLQLGADPASVTVRASGEDAPLIATADGVWEAQNRRVELRSSQ